VNPGELQLDGSSKHGADRVVREYEFGPFSLIPQPHNALQPARLLKGGREVTELTKYKRTSRLLIYLVERRESPVPLEELITELWPGESLKDQKWSLTNIIQKLRFALDKNHPHAYIERANSKVQFVYRPVKIRYHEDASLSQDGTPMSEPLGHADRDLDPARTNWIPRLNRFLGGGVEVCRIMDSAPILVDRGPMLIPQEQAASVASRRGELTINDRAGVLLETPHLGDDPVTLQVWSAEYAAVDVLDRLGKRPTMVSGATLVVCREAEDLVLHRRGAESRDYPHAIHTFGGSYSPLYDHESLVDTAKRETWEEIRLTIDTSKIPKMLLIREPDIAFLQLVLLGMGVSKEALQNAHGNWEGALVRIRFSDLESTLTGTESWVPSAKANILAWLALGAPISDGHSARFNGRTGQELFDSIVERGRE
jgi:8-oxo-dGTP pyrophosphatase MutT (NUDIX family)